MINPWITIVICYRDREYIRALCCLQSLLNQTDKRFEIIISDYGSKQIDISPIITEFPELKVQVIRTETDEVWSRSIALNIGLKAAKTKFVMTTDIDMLFDPRFIEAANKRVRRDDNKMLLHKQIYDTHPQKKLEDILEGLKSNNFWTNLWDYVPNSTRFSGGGACQVMLRKHVYTIGGFDEEMRIWGGEECDLMERWKQKGWGIQDHNETKFIHMYHRPTKSISRTKWETDQIKKNTHIYNATCKRVRPIVRNDGPWAYQDFYQ